VLLRDAGMEVIYTGLRQTPEMNRIPPQLQEDVDAVGVLSLAVHIRLCAAYRRTSKGERNGRHARRRWRDHPDRRYRGTQVKSISEVFLPGTSTENIVEYLNANVHSTHRSRSPQNLKTYEETSSTFFARHWSCRRQLSAPLSQTTISFSVSAQQTTVKRERKPGIARTAYRGGRWWFAERGTVRNGSHIASGSHPNDRKENLQDQPQGRQPDEKDHLLDRSSQNVY